MARARVYEVNGGSIVTPEGYQYSRNHSRKNEGQAPLVDTFDEAKRIREDFYGRAIKDEIALDVQWPRYLRYVGVTNSEQYLSDKKLAKWKLELFKHIAEDEQYLLINDAITTLLNDQGQPVEFRETGSRMRSPEGGRAPRVFYARSYEISGPMPRHVSVLAQDKGVQWVTSDGTYWEARIPNCTLAAAPVAHQAGTKAKVLLFSYSPEGVHYIIVGTKLNVTEDGIVH